MMNNFPGPAIFWTTLIAVTAVLTMATIVGRPFGQLFPSTLRGRARLYLAPVFGLATLTIIGSLLGRFVPLGNSVFLPCIIVALLTFSLALEQQIVRAFSHSAIVSAFGIICGISMLAALFVFGGFNPHNDTFTYLAHGNWLQDSLFGEVISATHVTPLTSQISLYQQGGFRMGASFLLALLQAVLNLRWSFEIYPAVAISAIASCCLAIGFPLARALRPMHRCIRFALLSLPALSMGGLVFGGNQGFLPQTVGLAFGAGLIFSTGSIFNWISTSKVTWTAAIRSAIPVSMLLAGTIYTYPELGSFLFAAVLGSGFIIAVRSAALSRMIMFGGMCIGFSALLLNVELLRVVTALKIQSGVAVGTPVEWPLLGYLAHAFGVHGGAWVGFQWSSPENIWSVSFLVGLALLVLVVVPLAIEFRPVWRTTVNGVLMPCVAVLLIFCAGLLYFRYFVSSPFPKGVGQSWSQFKLSDWAHPFLMAPVLLSAASLRSRFRGIFNGSVIALVAVALVGTAVTSVARVSSVMHYYIGVSDLNRFYLDFRKVVLTTCPSSAPIFLALGGANHKFRQMAALYLYDREVRSDWTDDGYIYPRLPISHRTQELTPGSCVVERNEQDALLSQGAHIGPFQVGVIEAPGRVRIASVFGAYGRESDGKNWWHWIERKVSFRLQPLLVSANATQTKLRFEYGTRGTQNLTVRVTSRDNSSQVISLKSENDSNAIFDKVIDSPPTEIAEVSIETDGKASRLGPNDGRVAAWVVRNVVISPVSP